jgi:hypothetical protein
MTERTERSIDVSEAKGWPSADAWQENRIQTVRRFRLGLDELKAQLEPLRGLLPARLLPERIVGLVRQPDGDPAPRLQLHLAASSERGWHAARETRFTTTDVAGQFVLALSPAQPATEGGTLTLGVRGADRATTLKVPFDAVDDNGLVGVLTLDTRLKPLPEGLLASLAAFAQSDEPGAGMRPIAGIRPRVAMREGNAGTRGYSVSGASERFPYAIFVRLVEPGLTAVTATTKVWADEGKKRFFPTVGLDAPAQGSPSSDGEALTAYVDRIPVDRPLDLDGLRRRVSGVGEEGTASAGGEVVPLAGTLGLGYVVHLAQRWTPAGLALGELIHSLPLAPGERQTIAVVEAGACEPSSALDTDASTESVFASAFDEAARAGSLAPAAPWSRDGSAILASGGGGAVTLPRWKKPAPLKPGESLDREPEPKPGAPTPWMESRRDFASRAALDLRTAVEHRAAARRRALGARIRPAVAGAPGARVLANPHPARMLTYQYWELQRLFEVATSVEGATLVCLVPLALIRFLPEGQPAVLADAGDLPDRAAVLARYARLLEHAGALAPGLPERHRRGLARLEQLAADPSASVEPAGAVADEVVRVAVRGTFLPFEEVTVTAVTRSGARVGPVRLGGTVEPIPAVATREALLGVLRRRRAEETGFVLQGDLALPQGVAREEVVGFELARHARALDYDLAAQFVPGSIRLVPGVLEAELGGPLVWDFSARLRRPGATSGGEAYAAGTPPATRREELPPGGMAVPALRLPSVLRGVQEIEATLQHVVRSTLRYSQAVWRALSPEERVMLLEGYTLGAPERGMTSEAHSLPLLQCVENRVLGFHGNAMLLPFHIPRRVADELGMTSTEVEKVVAEFHRSGLLAPAFNVALPARGMLGEAVLGEAAGPVEVWRCVVEPESTE